MVRRGKEKQKDRGVGEALWTNHQCGLHGPITSDTVDPWTKKSFGLEIVGYVWRIASPADLCAPWGGLD